MTAAARVQPPRWQARLLALGDARTEPVEALLIAFTLAWSLPLLLTEDIFTRGGAYSVMAEIAGPHVWGSAALFVAVFKSLAFLFGSQLWRRVAVACAGLLWCWAGVFQLVGGPGLVAGPFALLFAVASAWIFFRLRA